ncbi:DivIVA domain-containing protein [Mycoplasma nasistruthionis]|uniref:DivIVA domain-containing protein n=1 Tax=Mycoplasma nasistruthionis TaxID=353852 RepID=A0A4Y6I7I8_9MOLU|nr:DivIVA domain-containing protein [Mycoplasma nasistruthionis]QCZ36932.1 DivIVA domain-containing protein [Mycoplasma nasistruthionis]QDF65207.1 DivIVA domain-containing protein [Mycoplasma nasistruthionis]
MDMKVQDIIKNIEKQEFNLDFEGYSKKQVDAFLEKLSNALTSQLSDINDLKDELKKYKKLYKATLDSYGACQEELNRYKSERKKLDEQ